MSETKAKGISEKKTILVVEDEELLREMEHSILEGCGYRLLDADSGNQALELWGEQGEKIDLLLTDVMLPRGISGLELAKRLVEQQPRLKVIFTTGQLVSDLSSQALGKTNALFLQKPYQHTDLIKIVSEALKAP